MTSILPEAAAPEVRAAVARLPAYVAGRSAESELTAALASNESHFAPLPSVIDVISAEAARIHRYPSMAAADVREAVANYHGVTADEVAAGPGSSGVLQQIFSALCGHGDEVVFAWRSFEAYPILVTVAGAVPVPVPLLPNEHHDLPAMAAAVNGRTRVVILCSPNNPTGVSISAGALEEFLGSVPPHVLVVLDEAYIEFQRGPGLDALDFYRRYPNLCILRTFSKAYGLAGLRIGYAIARPAIAEGLRRTAIPFGVNRMAQAAAVASLAARGEIAERTDVVAAERSRVIGCLRTCGWDVPDSQANFYWLRASDGMREQILAALSDAGILARGYAGDGVRVTLADRTTNDRVLAVLSERGRFRAQ
ncbi:aminotransferase class I/II-fold pyridoxal phosphate-dependent enzyme [Pseudarthrobacter phenanthrenivorans]|uniref:Aromatic amino acid aminotransferase n=1 Tax=Pseudarthrobacter phenanthrenivorans TaxID=361575 RepID=A0A3B0FQ45_PSEPS|nr:histidinol-phosphate transaminase [Pseudarthrobacter phenanthrenivorans]RKO23711.1 aminotransferase class I/II-fold pyridoxal phosphate-dependent enzyme [Pseudarthrobacter phenanthrenivorans]TPV50529.1 aminotransferase class I/II-fold pyridoxal phosphate-dependent enzyme [Pseudarthrobacter phenanthrenivorans]